MPIVALAFGSFGDFVNLVQLCYTIIRTLTSTAGKSEEYLNLLRELDVLHVRLIQVEEEAPSFASSILHPHSSRNLLKILASCKTLLEKIQARTEHLEKLVKKRACDGKWLSTWRTVGWSLFRVDELLAFRSEIQGYNIQLKSFLSMRNHDALDRREREIQTYWKGYRAQPIRFQDYKGRKLYIEFDLCKSLQDLSHSTIIAAHNEPWAELFRESSFIFSTAISSNTANWHVELVDGVVQHFQYETTMILKPGMNIWMTVPVRVHFYLEIPGRRSEEYEIKHVPECDWPIWEEIHQDTTSLWNALRHRYPPRIMALLSRHRVEPALRYKLRIAFLTRKTEGILASKFQNKLPTGNLVVYDIETW